jgi:hypothetical protein
MMSIWSDSKAAHAADEAVKFDKSIEARSASIDCGFYVAASEVGDSFQLLQAMLTTM